MANCISCVESVLLTHGKYEGIRICLSTCKYSTKTYEGEIECDGYLESPHPASQDHKMNEQEV